MFIFGLIGTSLYLIIEEGRESFTIIDYIFLVVICYKAFMDIVSQLAVVHILCFVFGIIYDLMIMFPWNLFCMRKYSTLSSHVQRNK